MSDHTIVIIWVVKVFFCIILLCILATSSLYLLLLLGPYHFCPLFAHLCMKSSLGISNFLEEISSLSHYIVFFYFFHWSLRKAFLSLLAILWNSAFKCVYLSFSPLPFASLLFTAICKASSDNHFAFLYFFFLGIILIPASYTMSRTSVHSSSGILSDIIPWIYFSLPLYNPDFNV